MGEGEEGEGQADAGLDLIQIQLPQLGGLKIKFSCICCFSWLHVATA